MNNIFGLMRNYHQSTDLKINTSNPTQGVKIQEVTKEKIGCERIATENKMAKTSNALPDHPFKFPLPKPIFTKVSENT
jgi:hypothetical protein